MIKAHDRHACLVVCGVCPIVCGIIISVGCFVAYSPTSVRFRSAMVVAMRCSGNVTMETSFYDGEQLISKSVVRLFYV